MRMRAIWVGLGIVLAAAAAGGETVRGVVFHDKDGDGLRGAGERGVKDVGVSNGREVVATDRRGAYALEVDDDDVVFVIKPSGWMTPVSEDHVPQFFYVHKPAGSRASKFAGVPATGALPDSVDFPLYKQKEPKRFEALLFGDTQTGNRKQVHYMTHDVIEEVLDADAAFGVTLGDVVDNNLAMFGPLTRVTGRIGIPWYYVHGNHDTNQDAPDDAASDETWERLFGPPYYAFNWGRVHFLMLDNIWWEGDGYHGELGADQLAFVKQDLARVPKDRLVVAFMHIPVMELRDRDALFALLDEFEHTFSASAHWHKEQHFFLDDGAGWRGAAPHHHLVNGAVCGNWWAGIADEHGLPPTVMADGTQNGYVIAQFDKNAYELEYKVARRPASHQMNIYAPDVIAAADAAQTEVVVNVYFGSERSVTEMRVDGGPWTAMARTTRKDPYVLALNALEKQAPDSMMGRRTSDACDSPHIWTATLPAGLDAGAHVIAVRTTDMHGHVYAGRRIIDVE